MEIAASAKCDKAARLANVRHFWHNEHCSTVPRSCRRSSMNPPSGTGPCGSGFGATFGRPELVGRDIQKVEFGWPLGLPYCRSLGIGLWEVRSDLTDGKIGRVIFCVARERMVLLHGFVKKTRKTPVQDLKIALKRMKEAL
jgi:hypothetical protein